MQHKTEEIFLIFLDFVSYHYVCFLLFIFIKSYLYINPFYRNTLLFIKKNYEIIFLNMDLLFLINKSDAFVGGCDVFYLYY